MWAWIIFGLGSLALAAAGWLCALMVHFQVGRHVRECGMLLDYALDADDLLLLTDESLRSHLRELSEHNFELEMKLAEALSPARTVPLEAVDAPDESDPFALNPKLLGVKPKRANRTKRTGQEQT